jgi:hypothetical protein
MLIKENRSSSTQSTFLFDGRGGAFIGSGGRGAGEGLACTLAGWSGRRASSPVGSVDGLRASIVEGVDGDPPGSRHRASASRKTAASSRGSAKATAFMIQIASGMVPSASTFTVFSALRSHRI